MILVLVLDWKPKVGMDFGNGKSGFFESGFHDFKSECSISFSGCCLESNSVTSWISFLVTL